MTMKQILFGMGNPLLDITVYVDKLFLEKYNLQENNAIVAANDKKYANLYDEVVKMSPLFVPGGATQNTINVAQWIIQQPGATVFTGCIHKNDEFGKILKTTCEKNGVETLYEYYNGDEPTGSCLCLINGHNRSLVTFMGASIHFSSKHLETKSIKSALDNAKLYYVSGFFFSVSFESMMILARRAASKKNKKFLLNLSAPFVCEKFSKQLKEILPFVDILVGNEAEAFAFALHQGWTVSKSKDVDSIKNLAKKMAEWTFSEEKSKKSVRLVIITMGKLGVVTASGVDNIQHWPAKRLPADKIIDTNGAGDAFMGGFLAQYVQDKTLSECIHCASWAASFIIQQVGCSLPSECNYDPLQQ